MTEEYSAPVETTSRVDEEAKTEVSPPPTSEVASPLAKILQAEINDLISISTKYQADINSAKTNLKKTYFKKKLKRNNDKLFEMLIALNRHNKNKTSNHEKNKLAESNN